jgi:uncharacterized membrane protein
LATALTVLFWVIVGANGLLLLALVNQRAIAEEERDELLPDLDRVDDADNAVIGTTILVILLTIAIAVLFIIWMWRGANNNDALGRPKPRLSDGWTIGGWFIPIANFVIPVLMMQDLWRGSDAAVPRGDSEWRVARGSALIGVWWALLVASVIARIAGRGNGDALGEFESFERFQAANTLFILATILEIAAAVLAISVVRQLTRRQEQCLEAQQRAWQAAAPA